jgi:hypothetical protein
MKQPEVGDHLVYFANPAKPGDAYAGPFPASVVNVYPAVEANDGADPKLRRDAEPLRVDLKVRFSDGPLEHEKHLVRVVDAPEKYCCAWPEDAHIIDFDGWLEELNKDAARVDSEY